MLMNEERTSRTFHLLGEDALIKIQQSKVVIAGLGGVGSQAAEALARLGVGHLRLVDFDTVQPSNVNRQLYALESTLGMRKVDVAQDRIRDINPSCHVEILPCYINPDTMDAVLAGSPDFLVDAIDTIASKVELIAAGWQRGIPLVSCMGAARRRDPTAFRIGSLSQIQGCGLARLVRKNLRSKGVPPDINCVYSTEPPGPMPPNHNTRSTSNPGARRPLGSIPTVTGISGLMAAHAVLNALLKK